MGCFISREEGAVTASARQTISSPEPATARAELPAELRTSEQTLVPELSLQAQETGRKSPSSSGSSPKQLEPDPAAPSQRSGSAPAAELSPSEEPTVAGAQPEAAGAASHTNPKPYPAALASPPSDAADPSSVIMTSADTDEPQPEEEEEESKPAPGAASPLLATWVSDMAKEAAMLGSQQGLHDSGSTSVRKSSLLVDDANLLQDLCLVERLGGSSRSVMFDGLWQGGVRVAVKVLVSAAMTRGDSERDDFDEALRALGVNTSGHTSSSSGHPSVNPSTSDGPAYAGAGLPSAALTEALLNRKLSHPNVVRTYAIRCARLSLPFVAACQYALCASSEELREQVQLYLACLPPDVLATCAQAGSTSVEHVVTKVQSVVVRWKGSTPLASQRTGGAGASSSNSSFISQESTPSQDGFGAPADVRRPMSWQKILSLIEARPGDFVTVLIMRYCDMGTLESAINTGIFSVTRGAAATSQERRKRFRALVRTAREVAQGLQHLHACDVIHGNLKPSNVLLCGGRQDIRGFSVHVADFGMSRLSIHSRPGSVGAALEYMAPEVMQGKPVTQASDIYSFGLTMWAMASIMDPYRGLQPEMLVDCVTRQELRPEWPSNEYDSLLKPLYYSCVAPDPEKRPTAKEVVAQLATIETNVRNGMVWQPAIAIALAQQQAQQLAAQGGGPQQAQQAQQQGGRSQQAQQQVAQQTREPQQGQAASGPNQ